eukprot:scaffold2285_cov380-Prasinococcus_capsulatus_cf.AAC.8
MQATMDSRRILLDSGSQIGAEKPSASCTGALASPRTTRASVTSPDTLTVALSTAARPSTTTALTSAPCAGLRRRLLWKVSRAP